MKRKLILLIPVLFLMLNLAGAKIIEVPEAVGGVGLICGGTPAAGGGCSGTYGDNTEGASYWGSSNFQYHLQKIVLDCDGTATDIKAYLRDISCGTRDVKMVIYNDTGANHPGTKHSNSVDFCSASNGVWVGDATYLPTLTAGTYWVGILQESSASEIFYDDMSCTNEGYFYSESDHTPDADLTGVGTIQDDCYNIYIDF